MSVRRTPNNCYHIPYSEEKHWKTWESQLNTQTLEILESCGQDFKCETCEDIMKKDCERKMKPPQPDRKHSGKTEVQTTSCNSAPNISKLHTDMLHWSFHNTDNQHLLILCLIVAHFDHFVSKLAPFLSLGLFYLSFFCL